MRGTPRPLPVEQDPHRVVAMLVSQGQSTGRVLLGPCAGVASARSDGRRHEGGSDWAPAPVGRVPTVC
jgi:hypothetical protein